MTVRDPTISLHPETFSDGPQHDWAIAARIEFLGYGRTLNAGLKK